MLLTKLHIPQPKENVVHRSGLFEKLNEGLNRKLILVSATAGYGKTTLVSDWINHSKIPSAWYSIDNRDNDPYEFLTFIISGIQTIHKNVGNKSLELLKSPGTIEIEYICELLINDILTVKSDFLLVIDDLHLIASTQVYKILSFLVEHKPRNFKIAILTRSDPPLSLARMRSQNELSEIRSSDLSFTEHDTTEFFNKKLKLGLTEKDINLLELKTEGWIAGIQLTAITLQNKENVSEFILRIAGDNRYIMDYLIEEVLNTLDDETRDFLLKTSVFEKLSGSLCDSILQKSNSQFVLESLEKNNMFIVPLDNERQWFRYHHLFSDLLKQRLSIRMKENIPVLHEKASKWFEANDMRLLAIEHAIKAGKIEKALHLIESVVDHLWETSQYTVILKFGELLTEENIISNTKFGIAFAWVLVIMGKLEKAEEYLEKIELRLKKETSSLKTKALLGRVYETYNLLKVFSGDVEAAFNYSELAIENIDIEDILWNSWAHISFAESNLLRFNLDKCISSFKIAQKNARRIENLYLDLVSTSKTAYVLRLKGEYNKALNLCEKLLETFNSDTKTEEFRIGLLSSILYSIIGYIIAEQGKTEEGIKNALKGFELSRGVLSLSFQAYSSLLLAETYYKIGDFDKALNLVEDLEKIINKNIAQWLYVLNDSLKCKLLILKNEEQKAYEVLNRRDARLKNNTFESFFYNVAIARYNISVQKYDDAFVLLNDMSKNLESCDAKELLSEIELLKAKAYFHRNEKDEAVKAVLTSLLLTQSESFIRMYINEGDEIETLLKEINQRKKVKSSEQLNAVSNAYLNKLIKAFEKEKKTDKTASTNVLSPRELDTLKLLAENFTNQQIADELFVSLNTVKTHLKNINLKLEVENRNAAVKKAKELKII